MNLVNAIETFGNGILSTNKLLSERYGCISASVAGRSQAVFTIWAGIHNLAAQQDHNAVKKLEAGWCGRVNCCTDGHPRLQQHLDDNHYLHPHMHCLTCVRRGRHTFCRNACQKKQESSGHLVGREGIKARCGLIQEEHAGVGH